MTFASSPADRGGAGVAGPMGKAEGGFRQFSDDLQEALEVLAPESVPQEGEVASDPSLGPFLDALTSDAAELAGDAVADGGASAVVESLEVGVVLVGDEGAPVPGNLGYVWQAAAGDAPVADGNATAPVANEGGIADEAGMPLVRTAGAGGAAAGEGNGNETPNKLTAATAGGAGAPGFASGLGAEVAGAAGVRGSAAVPGVGPANLSQDPSDLPLSANRLSSIGQQVAGAVDSASGQGAEASVVKTADPAKSLSSSVVSDGNPGRTGDELVVEPKQRRWQVSLPPELRSQSAVVQAAPQHVPVVQADASSGVLQPQLQRGLAQAAGQDTGPKEPLAQPLKASGQAGMQVQVQPPGSAPGNSQPVAAPQVAEVSAAPEEAVVRQPAVAEVVRATPVITSVSQANAGQTANVPPPVTPVIPPNRPLSPAVAQPSTAEPGGVDLGLDDLTVEVDGEPLRLERRPAGDVSFAGAKAPSANAAMPQMPGLGSGQPQMVATQNGAGSGQQAAIPAAALSNEIGVDEVLPASAFEAELGADLDFTATLRGGDMQGAARTEALQTPNQAQSSQLASQVAVEMARNLKNAQTRFQMRFDPPELGRVDVNMKVAADGSVQAHLIVERPETLDMFLRDQRGLERALEAAGLNANSNDLQFSLKQGQGQQFASQDDPGQQNGQSGTENAGADSNGEASPDEAMDGQLLRMTLAEQRGGLDVRI